MRRLSIPEAARLLNVSEQVIWKKIERGELEYSKENGRIFVHVQEVTEAENRTEQSDFQAKEQPPQSPFKSVSNEQNKAFEEFLKKLIEQKDEQLASLMDENKELHEKLENALRENNKLSQGVHLEARKLLEIVLPNYNTKQIGDDSKRSESSDKKKKKKKKKLFS